MKRHPPEDFEDGPGPLFGGLLADARALVFRSLADGIHCPCCDQFCKSYTRRINSGMARALIWLVREWRKQESTGWIHIPTRGTRHVLANRELARFAFWGMVEARFNDDKTKKDSGYWRPTERGVLFADGGSTEPAYVVLYDNNVREVAATRIGIREALGHAFNYDELMHGNGL